MYAARTMFAANLRIRTALQERPVGGRHASSAAATSTVVGWMRIRTWVPVSVRL